MNYQLEHKLYRILFTDEIVGQLKPELRPFDLNVIEDSKKIIVRYIPYIFLNCQDTQEILKKVEPVISNFIKIQKTKKAILLKLYIGHEIWNTIKFNEELLNA